MNHALTHVLYWQFIFEAVSRNCTKLACQPNGSSLLEECLSHVSQEEKDDIFTKISYESLYLSQHSCGYAFEHCYLIIGKHAKLSSYTIQVHADNLLLPQFVCIIDVSYAVLFEKALSSLIMFDFKCS
jgi:hypothetical protein